MRIVHVTGHENSVRSSVASFIANLPELLVAMSLDPRCLVAVAVFEDQRYVQFRVGSDGELIAEVVSNLNITEATPLSDDDEQRLRAMGWSEPSPGPNPNWRFESVGRAGLLATVSMTRRAVLDVLREKPGNSMSLSSWAMSSSKGDRLDIVREQAKVLYAERLREIEMKIDSLEFHV